MTEREHLEQAIAAMESQRAELGDAVVDAAVGAFREALAGLEDEPTRGERRQVTVLFAEVTGFTELSADRDLEEVREIAGQLWTRLDAILTHAEGMIDKHAGDVVMAIFGARSTSNADSASDDAERAVRAALEMLAETRRFTHGQGLEQIGLRAGLNSGPVQLSAVGTTHEYTALGDTVNLASRLQCGAGAGEILISEATLQLIRGIFHIQTLEPLPVKGKPRPVPVYRVQGMRPRAFRVSQHQLGSASVMVGREEQISYLDAAFQDALESRELRALTLVGEEGLGKSRLVHEFLRRLDRSDQPFILFRGRPGSGLNGLGPDGHPYGLIRDLLSFRFKILESDPPALAREKLVRGVESWLGPEGTEAAHWIGHLAGFDFTDSAYLIGRLDDPRHARQVAFQALNRFVFAVAAHTPLLVLVDDLQRVDDGSLDWLESLMRAEPRGDKRARTATLGRATNGTVLVLCVSQPEIIQRRPTWDKVGAKHTILALKPLSRADTARLARMLLSAMTGGLQPEGSVERLVEQIAANAEGSPLFVEQMAQALLDAGALLSSELPGGGRCWRIDTGILSGMPFPTRLSEVIRARLEALPPVERQVLEHAAVIGPAFWESALLALLDGPEPASAVSGLQLPSAVNGEITQALYNLQARGLVVRRETSAFEHTEEYRFKNELLCQIAHELMPEAPRRAAHARVAGWLAAQSGERVALYTGAIAAHFERAEDDGQASGWYTLAAQQARRASAPEAAVQFYRRALDLLPLDCVPFARRFQIYKSLWDVQWWQQRFADALATGEALLAEAGARQDQAAQAAAWNRIAAVQNRQGDAQSALHSVQRAEKLARAAGDSGEVVMALFNRGLTLYRLGDSSAALEAGEQALAYNQSLLGQTASGEMAGGGAGSGAVSAVAQSDPDALRHAGREGTRILNLLAMIHQRAGRYELAAENYRQVLSICRIQGDQPGMISAYNNLGVTSYLLGDYRASAGYYQESLHLAEKQKYADLRLFCLNNLAGALVELGEGAQAEAALNEILNRMPENGSPKNDQLLSEVYRSLAQACLDQGRIEDAQAAGLRSLELARKRALREHQGRTWRVLGRIASQGGAAPTGGADPAGGSDGAALPVIDGRPCDAHACYAASMQFFVELGEAAEQARTARDWARYEMAHGDPREGARLWQEAIEVFSRLGLHTEVERMNQMRGDIP